MQRYQGTVDDGEEKQSGESHICSLWTQYLVRMANQVQRGLWPGVQTDGGRELEELAYTLRTPTDSPFKVNVVTKNT